MTHKVGKKMVQEVIRRVSTAVTNSGFEKFNLAEELYWARNVITWSMTDYGSWQAFCKQHIPMADSSIYRYVLTAELVREYKYTASQVKMMITGCGWTNFVLGILDMNGKVSVRIFIDRYRNFQVEERERREKPNSVGYAFRLPQRQASKLDAYLESYGMTISPAGHRRHVTKAMTTLVNRKL